jgi:hypothetical protein
MGYACPVCDDPQQDAEHLANHLAFQAMTHGDDHESWLDDAVPGWETSGPAELAPHVAAVAEAADYDVVFDDTTPDPDDGEELYDPDMQGVSRQGDGHDHSHGHGDPRGVSVDVDSSDLGPEERRIVDEARELTRKMLAEEADEDSDGDGDGE